MTQIFYDCFLTFVHFPPSDMDRYSRGVKLLQKSLEEPRLQLQPIDLNVSISDLAVADIDDETLMDLSITTDPEDFILGNDALVLNLVIVSLLIVCLS